jgi:hydroxymethylglutaryl-CoA synthase
VLGNKAKQGLPDLATQLDLAARLRARRRAAPAEFVATLELQERRYREAAFQPSSPVADLRPGTYYLCGVDALYRRTYARKPL